MRNIVLVLVLVLIGMAEIKARSDQKSLGCFKDGKELYEKLRGLVYEPNKTTRGGVIHFAAANNKLRRVVFKPGPSCPAGRQYLIVYDDLVSDYTTNPHPSQKKKKPYTYTPRTGEWSGMPGR